MWFGFDSQTGYEKVQARVILPQKAKKAAPALNSEYGVTAALQSSTLKVPVRIRLLALFITTRRDRRVAQAADCNTADQGSIPCSSLWQGDVAPMVERWFEAPRRCRFESGCPHHAGSTGE